MLLPSPTPEDLDLLRNTITRAFPNIMYVAFYRLEDGPDYHVFAHANEKQSSSGWKKFVHPRLENIVECENMKAVLQNALDLETFEEVGTKIARDRSNNKPTKAVAPAVKKVETRSIGTQTDPVVFADCPVKRVPFPGYRDYGAEMEAAFRIPPKSIIEGLPPYKIPYLTSRKVYLRESGVDVPDDYDSSIEKSREFEQQLRERRAVEDEALKIQATSGSIRKKPRKGVPKRLITASCPVSELESEEDSSS